jgi:hypothetical protein
MISRRAQENIFALLLLAFFVAVLVVSLGYGPRARLVPVPISILAILLLLFQIFWQNYRSADELNVDLLDVLAGRDTAPEETRPKVETSEDTAAAKLKEATDWKRILVALGFVALLVLMVYAGGPIPAIFVFTFGYFVISGHFRPVKAVIYTAVFTAAIYIVFVEILNIQLYHGYLDPVAEYLRRTF